MSNNYENLLSTLHKCAYYPAVRWEIIFNLRIRHTQLADHHGKLKEIDLKFSFEFSYSFISS